MGGGPFVFSSHPVTQAGGRWSSWRRRRHRTGGRDGRRGTRSTFPNQKAFKSSPPLPSLSLFLSLSCCLSLSGPHETEAPPHLCRERPATLPCLAPSLRGHKSCLLPSTQSQECN